MNYAIASSAAFLLAGAVGATEPSHGAQFSGSEPAARRSVCEYKSRDWSTMREKLMAVSQFRGANDANVQKIARNAIAGMPNFSIGRFELQYAHYKSGEPVLNQSVCFVKTATFEATNNEGNDVTYKCKASFDVKGKVLSVSCTVAAG
ncbi:hypothetical protein GNX71_09870 [Variovorax sp. RKNM96]|uniref:hypothetical protein n=1 Tax=Variovorax sp. RKNM96 TaxID=2681552 RepID=UPI0019823B36|nr:hypothetical protein [Variovorax sp. RKNM96]QSI29871.1 hypothetical protein GNX71_09870 [Variovorax sp. RKNM96]